MHPVVCQSLIEAVLSPRLIGLPEQLKISEDKEVILLYHFINDAPDRKLPDMFAGYLYNEHLRSDIYTQF